MGPSTGHFEIVCLRLIEYLQLSCVSTLLNSVRAPFFRPPCPSRAVARIFYWGGQRPASEARRSARQCGALPSARVRCASAHRSSCGRGPGAQPPENFEFFAHYIPHTSTFGNREQFLDQFFDNLKICIFCLCII